MTSAWGVHKFGGTSLADAGQFRRVVDILRAEEGHRKAIVVSAMSKVTDELVQIVTLAGGRNDEYLSRLDALRERHEAAIEALLPEAGRRPLLAGLAADFSDIKEILRGCYLSRNCSEDTADLILGHGELWSAQLLNAHLGV